MFIINKYDEFFDFRLAKKTDVDNIMLFLKENWGKNHILANNKEMFIWQYGNQEYGDEENINVVLMCDKKGEIVGLNGFVVYSRSSERRYVSSAITKVKADLAVPLCGVELIKRFRELVPAKAYYSSGTNPKTIMPIGKRVFRYETGLMQQYYILNERMETYDIAKIKYFPENVYKETNYKLFTINNEEQLFEKFNFEKEYFGQGYKSCEYIKKRYFKHPVYQYLAWGIAAEGAGEYKGILFARILARENKRALRIVDYLGDINYLGEIGKAIRDVLYENEYEYVELPAGTLPLDLMKKAGFALRLEDDTNIIPTYFEPFVQENVNIWFQKSDANIVIFKADGDQDRPSIWIK